MGQGLPTVLAVLALILMTVWLPTRAIPLAGGFLAPHDHLGDTALPASQAVLERPAAPALPAGPESQAAPGAGFADQAPPSRTASPLPPHAWQSLSGPPRPAARPRAPPVLA